MATLGFGKPKKSNIRLCKKDLARVSAYNRITDADDGFIYLDCSKPPFVIGGIAHPSTNGNEYYRLDVTRRDEYSPDNRFLAENTAGGTVRFATDADEISVRVTLRAAILGMHHFCDRGVYGIDAYCGTGTARRYIGANMQTFADKTDVNAGKLTLPAGVNEVLINLPLYAGIKKIEVGFPKRSFVGAPTERTCGAIGFYGSSITQGGCVSRPANAYTNIICRALDADCCNFGFSGSAMGEHAVAEYIASRDLACFVMDYDYNAPTAEHLKNTHEPFFKIIRTLKPDLPVVFVTHPFYSDETEFDTERIEIIKQTYQNAVAAGDKKVWFVDSREFFTKEYRDLYAVDNLHPNDLGQMSMAQTIFPVIKKALGSK